MPGSPNPYGEFLPLQDYNTTPNQRIDLGFPFRAFGTETSCGSLARREEMDQLTQLLGEVLDLYMERSRRPDAGRQVDAAGKMPAVGGGESEEQMEMREEMPSNGRSDVGLKFLAAEKRPAVQGGDAEGEMEMQSKRISEEGLQLHAAEQRPGVQGGDADEMDAVTRSEVLQNLMQSIQPGDQKQMLAKLLKYEEENQLQKHKVLQILIQRMQPSDQKDMLAKLLKHEEENQPQKQENLPQKQENQPRKQKKKNHRKSRMALRKVEMDKVKKSNLEKAPIEDKAAAYLAAWAKEREAEPESEAHSDWHAYQARLCRDRWDESWTYETPTPIPPMRFTDYVDASAGPRETLQIFSVKVVGVKEGVVWPLYVYGKLAVRDTVDRKRNIIFDRQRENFQTITEQDPYLTLTGPSRAAVLSVRHSYIEAELKLKGSSSDSDDKDFSYLAVGYIQTAPFQSFMVKRVLSSKLSTLELTVGYIVNSVEATITMEVSSGKWPYGHGGAFTISTASMDAMEIVLLAFADDGLPLEDDGKKIRLCRRVVGVEVDGRLNVKVKASPLPGGSSTVVLSDEQVFIPKEASRSQLMLKVGSCEMKVTVAWSLLLTYDNA